MNTTKLLSDLQMLCGCISEIKNKDHIKKVGERLEDIIGNHFPKESKVITINSNGSITSTITTTQQTQH